MDMVDLWLAFGAIGATILLLLPISLLEVKSGWEGWKERLGIFMVLVIGGFLTLIAALYALQAHVALLSSYGGKCITYTYLILFLAAILTQCNAPREGAHCNDGTYSYATGQGACSWHGGVDSWDHDYWWEE